MNLYTSLFEGEKAPLTAEQRAELDRLTAEAEQKVAAMSDEEKAAEWERIKSLYK